MNCSTCASVLRVFGRVLFSLPIFAFGVMHFMKGSDMVAYVPSYFPAPTFWVYFTGVIMVVAALLILVNKFADYAGILLGITLLSYALLIHLPVFMGGDQSAMPNLLKDLALSGFAFYAAGTYCKATCETSA
jgi:uncharacterized membrane protein YphA (DoxX/SURF4 family)